MTPAEILKHDLRCRESIFHARLVRGVLGRPMYDACFTLMADDALLGLMEADALGYLNMVDGEFFKPGGSAAQLAEGDPEFGAVLCRLAESIRARGLVPPATALEEQVVVLNALMDRPAAPRGAA